MGTPLLTKADNCLDIRDSFELPIFEKKFILKKFFDSFILKGINFLFSAQL